jgi:hypothetical protein
MDAAGSGMAAMPLRGTRRHRPRRRPMAMTESSIATPVFRAAA